MFDDGAATQQPASGVTASHTRDATPGALSHADSGAPHVRPVIREAWQRSRKYGLDPRTDQPPSGDAEQPPLSACGAELARAASPALASLDEAIGDVRHIVALADPDGVLCQVRVDMQTHAMAWAINLRAGASWHERDMGCNALGTALATEQPLIVAGPEHSMPAYAAWTSVGIPIHGRDGDIAGALQLSLPFGKTDTRAWHLALAAAQRIEARLAAPGTAPDHVGAGPALPEAPRPLQVVREVLELLAEHVELPPPYRRFVSEARAQLDAAEFEWLAAASETSAALARQAIALDTACTEAQEGMRRLALVAHDLKGPLTLIIGSAQIIAQDLEEGRPITVADLKDGLARIVSAARQLSTVADTLLDTANIESPSPPAIQAGRVNLTALVRTEVREQQVIAGRRRIIIHSGVPALIGEGDRELLRRALHNLLSNAIKYSPDGSEIGVTLAREAADDRLWAVLAVRDQGIGIPEADLERVFEPFVRGANVEGRIHGTGLGLARARQILEEHGGTLTVESEEGHGATFTMRLPLSPRDRPDDMNHRGGDESS